MTDTMTSQNIDLSSWDTLYKGRQVPLDSVTNYNNIILKTDS